MRRLKLLEMMTTRKNLMKKTWQKYQMYLKQMKIQNKLNEMTQ